MSRTRPMPALACDAHMHVYDAGFAHAGTLAGAATAHDYQHHFQKRVGTRRTVVVTPRPYGVDNAVTLDAIRKLGLAHTRGVAVLHPDVSDAELARLHAGGIRGVRFTLYTAARAAVGFDMVEPLAQRIQALGWHVQLHWTADQIVAHASLLRRLPSRIVFDHLGRLPMPQGTAHPAFAIVRGLLERGRTWMKLSGPYLDSRVADYADVATVARAWIAAAPERLVWGSDWPHVTETHDKPDDIRLAEALSDWVEDDATYQKVLVTTPAELYGFEPLHNNHKETKMMHSSHLGGLR
ncbi:amidohydrolase family protein [Robbsia sp. Bb-Pol-6]|uniref:Amidohydrolase family protein n=1 Tax=Robbsia betulipollinis TaxID=2981849 RepID=A0ABT3ZI70_9BURK|nr:amidohydrolase family protein [Robbsia betulipollinis]MCY0386228.1 amidohydrolase family protein [Robbsia betulipollinis]